MPTMTRLLISTLTASAVTVAAGAAEIAPGFLPGGRGALVNSSRGILYAHRKPEHAGGTWQAASSAALDAMITELRAAAALA